MIVSINPLREDGHVRFAHPQLPLEILAGGEQLAREHIAMQIGGDHALFLGVGKAVLELGAPSVLDGGFLAQRTEGFAAWRAHAQAMPWDAIVHGSGVDEATIRAPRRSATSPRRIA